MLYKANLLDSKYIDNRIRVIKNTLNYYDKALSENVLFILGEGIDFNFEILNYENIKGIGFWFANGMNREFEYKLFSNLNIFSMHSKADSEQEQIDYIYNNLAEKRPVLTLMDDEMIQDYKVTNSDNLPAIRCLSTVAIIGIDKSMKSIYLDYLRERTEITNDSYLEVPLEKFLLATAANCIPNRPDRQSYTLSLKEINEEVFNNNTNAILIKCLLNICNNMLGIRKSAGNSYRGVDGIKKLVSSIEMFLDTISDDKLDSRVVDKVFFLKFRILRKTLLKGSNTCYRMEFGQALKEISVCFSNGNLNEIGDEFIDLGKKWLSLSRVISIFRTSEKIKYISKVTQLLAELAISEEVLFNKLRSEIISISNS